MCKCVMTSEEAPLIKQSIIVLASTLELLRFGALEGAGKKKSRWLEGLSAESQMITACHVMSFLVPLSGPLSLRTGLMLKISHRKRGAGALSRPAQAINTVVA